MKKAKDAGFAFRTSKSTAGIGFQYEFDTYQGVPFKENSIEGLPKAEPPLSKGEEIRTEKGRE